MFDLRPSVALLALLIASCGDPQSAKEAAKPADANADDSRIDCALRGAAEFRRECTVDRAVGSEGLMLTIRAPDGGFRRLRVTKDGRGVIAADGAIPATVTVIGENRIEIRIAGDRYRLPATVK